MSDDKRRYEAGQLIAAMLRPTEPTGLFALYSRRRRREPEAEPEQSSHNPDNPVDPLRAFLRSITGHTEQEPQ